MYDVIGANIKTARNAICLTQAGLAERTGYSRPGIANIEAGRQRVPIDHIAVIANAIGIPPYFLLKGLEGFTP